MNTQPTVWDFLVEIFKRLSSKSPKFFVWLQWIFMVLAFVSGIGEIFMLFDAEVPLWLQKISSKTVAISALLGLIVAKMPAQAITSVDANVNKLPFTAKQQAVRNEPSATIVNIIPEKKP